MYWPTIFSKHKARLLGSETMSIVGFVYNIVIFSTLWNITLGVLTTIKRDFFILEGQPPGTFVGNLSTKNLKAIDSNFPTQFKVDSLTGVITSTVILDREQRSRFTFSLIGKSSYITVKVIVKDINDEEPTFTVTSHVISISEAHNVGYEVDIGEVSDKDEGLNTVQADTVRILSGNIGNAFNLTLIKVSATIYRLKLVIATKLNRSKRERYYLNITASDKGKPIRTSYLGLTIQVKDFNDCPPKFLKTQYIGNVSENAPKETDVLTVTTSDCDFGKNAEVVYSIVYAPQDTRYFRIQQPRPNHRSGIIQTNVRLDYETKREHNLRVQATDKGDNPKTSLVDVVIYVLDENDHYPEIGSLKFNNVYENARKNFIVATVAVNDKDSGKNAELNVTIQPDNVFSIEKDSSSGYYYVYLQAALDREVKMTYIIIVSATDNGDPPRKSQNAGTLVVGDINDNPPKFNQTIYTTSVLESAKIGSTVLTVYASDPDSSSQALTYHILSAYDATYSHWFDINATTGIIRIHSELDREKFNFVILTVQVRDGLFVANCTVNLTILDVNDNSPSFSLIHYIGSVYEERPMGQVVLRVNATDKDNSLNSTIVFSIDQNFYTSVFTIDNITGDIFTNRKLDRENKEKYEFGILATDEGGLIGKANITVIIKDVNDNPPYFHPQFYNKTVLENATVGSIIVKLHAFDNDDGLNAWISYDIVSSYDENTFILNKSSGELRLQKQLNREKQDKYFLKFRALDNGGHGLVSSNMATVEISVEDVNDDPPKFEKTSYQFHIIENTKKNRFIGVVTAKSRDKGSGAVISYSIKFSSFFINGSGAIFANNALDHEERASYIFTVEARDHGNPPLFGYVNVSIKVIDVNDNTPKWNKNNVTVFVPENKPIGYEIYRFVAHDGDSGKNGEVAYRITKGATRVFKVNEKNGSLTLLALIDYEKVHSYRLTVKASDCGRPSLSSFININIVIQDVNDNSPEMNGSSIHVREDISVGRQLFQFHAVDKDSGVFGKVWYKLHDDPDSDNFQLNKTGSLTLKSPLDREKSDKHVLQIVVGDGGEPSSKSPFVKFIVYVDDANDQIPYFLKNYEFSTTENEKAGTFVGTVEARDLDIGRNAELEYVLLNSTEEFQIDSGTGVMKTNAVLDREKRDVHYVRVQVSDKGTPSRNNSTIVIIYINDVNDNAPEFSREPYKVSVAENDPKGTIIVQVKALDRDKGLNGEVLYYLNTGNAHNGVEVFQINQTTGKIYIVAALDRESKAYFVLSVVANDKGRPRQDAISKVFVTVLDVNDHRPSFSVRNDSVSISEKTKVGSRVYQANATDPDEGDNGNIIYSIKGSSYVFRIDVNSGSIYLTQTLDYEKIKQYIIKIQASDNAKQAPKESILELYINVVDSNDNSPFFDKNPIFTTVTEGVKPGTNVHSPIIAKDYDSGFNSRIVYSIISQKPRPAFKIDPFGGQLATDIEIDREQVEEYTLVIKAIDQAPVISEQLSSTVTVKIIVLDVNDCYPEFTSRKRAFVMEDEPIGYPIFKFDVTDKDKGQGGKVVYSIVSGNDDSIFELDSSWGSLILKKGIDREKVESYKLQVKASDNGTPRLSTTINFTITVEDVNDNKPRFAKTLYHANISEGENSTEFLQVEATDADSGPRGKLSYSIPVDISDNKFVINEQTGSISTAVTLDREKEETYQLTVYTRDNFYPNYTDSATVIVRVLDKNDNRPTFLKDHFEIDIPENKAPGYVFTIIAHDLDEGVNAKLRYSIVSGNDDKAFVINEKNGTIKTTAKLDRETIAVYNLTVEASDCGNPKLKGTVFLTIKVCDENDNRPRFGSKVLNVSISENISPGSTVLKLKAVDDDAVSDVVYSFENDEIAPFGLDSKTGELYTLAYLNSELKKDYQLTVRATSRSMSNSLSRTIKINIDVNSTMKNIRFSKVLYDVQIDRVTNNLATGDSILHLQLNNDNLRYGDVEYKGDGGQSVLQVDRTSGNVSFAVKPDNNGAYFLRVRATLVGDQSNSAVCFVIVTVKKSTQRPTFHKKTYNITLDEDVSDGTFVVKLKPETPGKVTYEIINGNHFNAFRIDDHGEVTVSNSSGLDYERTCHFELDIYGDWGVFATNISFVKVYITIRNLADKAPVFRQKVFDTQVYEKNGVRQRNSNYDFVANLSTYDFGNFQKSFAIISGNEHNVFSLSPKGELGVQARIDRESNKIFNLTVRVGLSNLYSTCNVVVRILDVNDNAPIVQRLFVFNISEHMLPGFRFGQIKAHDKDESSLLQYSFANGKQRQDAFVIDLYTGSLYLVAAVDYENAPVIRKFTAFINDGRFQVKTEIKIHILDYNDNKPRFERPSYSIKPAEKVPANYTLGQVNATDRDSGVNGNITYHMTAVDGVSIDMRTGVIFSTEELQYDPFRRFIDAIITASDMGSPPLCSKVPVRIEILDTRSQPPKFANISYNFNTTENKEIGTAVKTIKAIYPDPDPYSIRKRIFYRITGGTGQDKFKIDERTGVLRVSGQLDRETAAFYNLLVQARDSSDHNNYHTIPVNITIIDVNDNAPIFQRNRYYSVKNNESMYNTTVSEAERTGVNVLTVLATDKDDGLNSEIQYSISSGNDGAWFSIADSGKLFLANTLDRDVIPIHRLSVRAIDKGNPPKASEISVVITVNDINDNAPVFVTPQDLGVAENAPVGTAAGNITATDSDTGKNKLIFYSIVNGSGLGKFVIDNETGQLRTSAVFDYEKKSSYTLVIRAEDQGSPKKSTLLKTVVAVQSVDEYEPVFSNESYSFIAPGNSKKEDVLGQVHAIDMDDGPDGVVVYELASPVEPFAMNASSGEIYLTEDFLDYKSRSRRRKRSAPDDSEDTEQPDSEDYELIVSASSGRLGSKSDDVFINMKMDYSCEGCQPRPKAVKPEEPLAVHILIVVIIASIIIVFSVCAAIVYIFVVRKRREQKNKNVGSAEAIGLQTIGDYGGRGLTNPYAHVPSDSVSNSQASATSSSGHGSSEVYPDECDDGITDVKIKSYNPDSGVHVDFENDILNASDNSETRSSDVRSDRTDRLIAQLESRESLHEFDDEGGREASGGVDVGNLLYAKLAEADAEEDDQNVDRPRVFKDEGRPDYTGSLSSILGSHEELRVHYNYFYTMNQGPQYQPLSEVFSEIGRLPVHNPSKDDNDLSGRTSLLSSVSSLNNAHLDAESTFSSLPITPNFTPAITPLITRTPSLSPLTSEAVTPTVSPSASRPSSMYLLGSRSPSSLVQMEDKNNDLDDIRENIDV